MLSSSSLQAGLAMNNLTDQLQAQVQGGQLSPQAATTQANAGYQQFQTTASGETAPPEGHRHHHHHHAAAANQVLTGAMGPQVPNN
ncbi:MAG TPA: hypothetical protein VGO93_25540 [Candidatus Xenobia bacterium]|jgi:hypothetical protein